MEINLFGVGSIELDKISLKSVGKIIGFAAAVYLLLLMVCIKAPLPYTTSNYVLCDGECSLESVDFHKCFKLDFESNVNEFTDKITDTFKLELKFTVDQNEFKKFGQNPNFRYSLDVAEYKSNSCSGDHLYENKVNYNVDFISCDNEKRECKNIFLAEKYYFNSSNFKLDLSADTIPYSSIKAFSKIEILLTQRDYSYIKVVTILKLSFTILSIGCLLFFLLKIKQFSFSDIGIIQRKVINLIIFLILFNEPFYYFNAYVPFKTMNVLNTIIQVFFFIMILHFWTYVLDTLSEEEMIREDPIKFYFPKICIVLMIGIFMLITFSLVRFEEIRDPSYFWKYELNYHMLKYLSWVLILLLSLYSAYIFAIAVKANGAIRIMSDNKKFIVSMTISVIAVCMFLFVFFGIHSYVSMSCSVLKIASIQGLMNLYIFLAAYFYSPCFLGQKVQSQNKNDDRQIINDLYSNELPEMPTMSHDPENYGSKTVGYQLFSRKETEDSQNNQRDIKRTQDEEKKKIWESIQKQAEDEGNDQDEDSDENQDVPNASAESESSSDN